MKNNRTSFITGMKTRQEWSRKGKGAGKNVPTEDRTEQDKGVTTR
jgi:hypothetical protein